VDRYVTPFGHNIIIIFFAFTPYFRVIRGEAANIIFIVICLTQPGFEPTIYRTNIPLIEHLWIARQSVQINH
jgi:hypothetical protein